MTMYTIFEVRQKLITTRMKPFKSQTLQTRLTKADINTQFRTRRKIGLTCEQALSLLITTTRSLCSSKTLSLALPILVDAIKRLLRCRAATEEWVQMFSENY